MHICPAHLSGNMPCFCAHTSTDLMSLAASGLLQGTRFSDRCSTVGDTSLQRYGHFHMDIPTASVAVVTARPGKKALEPLFSNPPVSLLPSLPQLCSHRKNIGPISLHFIPWHSSSGPYLCPNPLTASSLRLLGYKPPISAGAFSFLSFHISRLRQ